MDHPGSSRPVASSPAPLATSGRRLVAVLLVALLAFGGVAGAARPALAQDDAGVATLTGNLQISNPGLVQNFSQIYMTMFDLNAFVQRDFTLPPTPGSQILAELVGTPGDEQTFTIPLPIQPQGTSNDLGNGEGNGDGVQVFSVDLALNIEGGPYIGPYEGGGWSTSFTSLVTRNTDYEVIGGQVAVWAPDDEQAFPTGFGDDGLLFTEDDPTGPIPAGWTVVSLDEGGFTQDREPSVEVAINVGDEGFTDYSDQSFTESFDSLLADLRNFYAYTEEKGIDFDALEAEYRPRIEDAEADDDFAAFQDAMFEFSLEFNDGHVGTVPSETYIPDRIGGRLGMRVMPTDSGDDIVVAVTEGLPAAEAGILPGAQILEWDGGPIEDALAAEPPLSAGSTAEARLLDQYRFLTRGPLGDTASVTFQNPDADEPETVELTFSQDVDGADVGTNTRVDVPVDDYDSLPVSSELLPSGVGYVRINGFSLDPILFTTAWDNAIQTLVASGAVGILVDVRGNGGGYGILARYAAGTFTDEQFTVYEDEAPDFEGGYLPPMPVDVLPVDLGVGDLPVGILTDASCASACEIMTAAVANDPEHLVISYTNTAGIEAAIYQWALSGGLPFQASYIRTVNPDGSLFLEGYGVTPNVRIPHEPETLILTDEDTGLVYADAAMVSAANGDDPRNQEGGNIPPEAAPDGTPVPDATPDLDATADDAATPAATPEAGDVPESTPEI